MSTITSITYRPADNSEPLPQVGYRRVALTEALLQEGQGIGNDSKAHSIRNLNIMDALTLAELATEGFPSMPGALGENLIVDDLDVRTPERGTQLRLSEHIVVKIVVTQTGCAKFHGLDTRMPDNVQGRIGVMAEVVQGGRIKVGDPVEVM